MSCFEDSVEEPLWAMNLKDYDRGELESLVGFIDSTRTWLQANGLNAVGSEDIIGFRVGIPVVSLTDVLETQALYTAGGDSDQLIKSISLDALKVSAKVTVDGVQYTQPYTFKSAFIHDIFSTYFHAGVENLSGFPYLANLPMNLSNLSGLPVQYGGVTANAKAPLPIPPEVYGCVVYLMQNTTLYVTDTGSTATKGDVTYYSTKGFYDKITTIRATTLDKINRIATPYQEDIHELLVYLGMDKAFRDIQFGGSFTDMRIAMRIPSSRSNRLTLEGLMGQGDVFDDIFKTRLFAHNDADIEGSEKKEDLQDLYSDSKADYAELDDSVEGYGCKGTFFHCSGNGKYYPTSAMCAAASALIPDSTCSIQGNKYRYWYVSKAWLDTLTTEQLTIVFWMGLDIMTEQGNPCPYDKILAIIIVVVLTFMTAGIGSGTAITVMQGLTILSGILSIASITGIIDPKTAMVIGALLAIATLGASMVTAGTTTTSILSQALSIAGKILDTVQKFELDDFLKEMESKTDSLDKLGEDAELWESNFRFTYGGSFEMGVRNGPEADPYQYLKDAYKDYSVYTTPGFQ